MDYHLKPVGKVCEKTGKELEPGEFCYSVLKEQNGRYIRLDFCEEGWEGLPEEAVGYWKTRIPEPKTKKKQPLDADSLMRYFEQLSEESNPAQEKFRYILALLLLQKRKLQLEGSVEVDDREMLEFHGVNGEGPFHIVDQHLTDEEIENLEHDLNSHLVAEWT